MEEFYRRIMDGEPRAAALRAAQLNLKGPTWTHILGRDSFVRATLVQCMSFIRLANCS